MADNNLARNRNDGPEFFADDDPLAELARIVGYEERPTGRSSAAPHVPHYEPAFNLEDELLREFERYDTPRLDPSADLAAGSEADLQMGDAAPALDPFDLHGEPANDFAPAAPLVADASFRPQPVHSEPLRREEPVLDVAEFPAQDASPMVDVSADLPVSDLQFSESDIDLVAELPRYEPTEPVSEPVMDAQPVVTSVAPPSAEPYGASAPVAEPENFDLASELETAIAAAPVAEKRPEQARRGAYTPSFRMPLANFHAAQGVTPVARVEPAPVSVEPEVQPPVQPEPVREEAIEPVAEAAPSVPPASVAPQVEEPAPVSAPVSANAPEQADVLDEDTFVALDELIYDVERYAAAPHENQASAPVAEAPPTAAPVVAPAPRAEAPQPVAKARVEDIDDPFADEEFDLVLEDLDLDLDLGDLSLEEDKRVAEVKAAPSALAQAPVAPAPVKAEAAPSVPQPRPRPVAPVAPAPVVSQAAPAIAPVAAAAAAFTTAPAVPAFEADTSETPDADASGDFDPTLIAVADEHPEALADFDVPALPAEEPEHAPVYRPDYDLDIDAELATLLQDAAPAKPAPVSRANASVAAATTAAKPVQAPASAAKPTAYDELDDFERALEEDFRRSLATPLPQSSARYAEDDDADMVAPVAVRRFSARNILVPVAFLGVLVLGGGGIWAWLQSGSGGLVSGGDPVVIAADTDPIKVAPENPGGKTVPNQDKAVYDRVAGAAQEDPKQETLISSNEEPVDVVQKTLMPETLPLEGENDAELAATEVGDTEDPRLLPQEEEQGTGPVSGEQQPIAVAPRKVKTMIVRPDGSLVEQEVPAAEVAARVPALAAPSTVENVAAAPAKTVEVASVPETAPGASPVLPAPAAETPAVTAPMAPEMATAPAEAAPAPIRSAPIPVARPAEQPVNVVASVSDQGNVRPAGQAAQAPAATQAPGQASDQAQANVAAAGGYVIQIASLPTQGDAERSYKNLSTKFGSVIGGRGVDIKAAEIAGKGTFYRVRIPAGSKADAVALCERYRAVGGSCLVAR